MTDRICSVEACERLRCARGWCNTHYQRWRIYGNPLGVAPKKPRRTCSVAGCDNVHRTRGYCQSHLNRVRKHGDPLAHIPLIPRFNTAARFWAKVDKRDPDDCWFWTAHISHTGHGMFRYDGDLGLASRYSYELHNGPITNRLYVLHRCGKAACVNPAHLYLGTQKENCNDRDAHGTTARGERSGKAKFTNTEADRIRQEYRRRNVSCARLAAEYGVSASCIYGIVRGATYRT